MEFSGRLGAFPVPDLLQWVKTDRKSGILVVRRGHRRKRLLFRQGDLLACFSNDVCDYYGQYLLLHGHLEQAQLFQALAHCRTQRVRLGQALVDLGLLPKDLVARTLKEQISDSVCDLFLWRDGVFFFDNGPPPEEGEILPEPIDMTQLVMEGAVWMDQVSQLRKVVPHDSALLGRGPAWPGEDLPPLQRRMAQTLRTRRTFAELQQLAKSVKFRCLEAVAGLVEEEVAVVEKVRAAPEPESTEVSIYDLLFENLAREGFVLAGERLVLPADWLLRLFPVWAHAPSQVEMARLSPDLRFFWASLDGEKPLSALLSERPETRHRQLELLLLEVRWRNVVLLPLRPRDLAGRVDPDSPLGAWWRREEVEEE